MFGGLIKTPLMDHQRTNLDFHLVQPRTADFSEMGCGKSLIALGKIAHLIMKGEINRALVISPMSAMASWEIEIKKHTGMTCVPLRGQLFEKGEILTKNQKEDIYLISYDSIPGRKRTRNIMLSALRAFGFDMVICDEVPLIKTYETLRFQSVVQLCDDAKYVLFLTGTPITNRPETIFNIYRALDRGETFGTDLLRTRNKYFRQVGVGFPVYKLREDKRDELTHKMYLKAIRIRKDECLSLPPKIFSPRYCNLSDEQHHIYYPVAEELVKKFKMGDHKFRIMNPLTKLSKLSQICSGFMYDDSGKAMYIKDNSKASLLEEVLNEIGEEKVVIYTRWKEDVPIVSQVLRSLGRRSVSLLSETKDRKAVIESFQDDPEVKVLIASTEVGGYSITLTASSYAIYYSLNFPLDDWLQSQDRIHRKGQTKTCVYIPLMVNNTVDTYIYGHVAANVDLATSIVDPMKYLEDSLEDQKK